jgi:hypothetical protein
MSAPEQVYSVNEEEYYDLEQFVECHGEDLEVGQTIYVAEKRSYVASDFCGEHGVDHLIEYMQDQAWQAGDQWSEGFAELSDEKYAELKALLSTWLNANVPVNFWTAEGPKRLVLTDENIVDFKS